MDRFREIMTDLRKLFDGLDKGDEDREEFERQMTELDEAIADLSAEQDDADADSDGQDSREVAEAIGDAMEAVAEKVAESVEGLEARLSAFEEKVSDQLEDLESSRDVDADSDSDVDDDDAGDEPDLVSEVRSVIDERFKELEDKIPNPRGQNDHDDDKRGSDKSDSEHARELLASIREKDPRQALELRHKFALGEVDLDKLEALAS